jgi:hypothetical protein
MALTTPHRVPPTVLEGLELSLPPEDVWRFLGYPEGVAPPRGTAERIAAEIETARGWIQAKGAFRIDPAVEQALLDPPRPPGDERPAVALALGLVTAGPVLDEQVRHRLAADDAAGALLLDAVGSAAAEEAADQVCCRLAAAARGDAAPVPGDRFSGCRVSPGYGGWPLEAQTALFRTLPHEAIGVHLLASFLMVPRKSISFALWLDSEGAPLADLSDCARCLNRVCRHRRT